MWRAPLVRLLGCKRGSLSAKQSLQLVFNSAFERTVRRRRAGSAMLHDKQRHYAGAKLGTVVVEICLDGTLILVDRRLPQRRANRLSPRFPWLIVRLPFEATH